MKFVSDGCNLFTAQLVASLHSLLCSFYVISNQFRCVWASEIFTSWISLLGDWGISDMTFKTFSVSVMAKCGFSKFVGYSCGHGTSSADTQCVILSECKKDVKPHLRGFKMWFIPPSRARCNWSSPEQVLYLNTFHQMYLYLELHY